jgi:anthranilate/para-aminobenzoate synthase component II
MLVAISIVAVDNFDLYTTLADISYKHIILNPGNHPRRLAHNIALALGNGVGKARILGVCDLGCPVALLSGDG